MFAYNLYYVKQRKKQFTEYDSVLVKVIDILDNDTTKGHAA